MKRILNYIKLIEQCYVTLFLYLCCIYIFTIIFPLCLKKTQFLSSVGNVLKFNFNIISLGFFYFIKYLIFHDPGVLETFILMFKSNFNLNSFFNSKGLFSNQFLKYHPGVFISYISIILNFHDPGNMKLLHEFFIDKF